MTFRLGHGTRQNLRGCHPTILELAELVITRTTVDFCVIPGGGFRSKQQAENNAKRGTGVLTSRHLTGDAIDFVAFVDGKPSWELKHYGPLMECVYECADELNFLFVHGADWNCNGKLGEAGTKEWDWPHIQRPWPWQVAKAEAAAARRKAEREPVVKKKKARKKKAKKPELSPDITPGINPEDMSDDGFSSPAVEGVE